MNAADSLPTGIALLHDPLLNKGTAFSAAERDYTSVRQMKGSLSQRACPDPAAFERANYMKALKSCTSRFA